MEEYMGNVAYYMCFPPVRTQFFTGGGDCVGLIIDEEGNLLAKSAAPTAEEARTSLFASFENNYRIALGDRKPQYCAALELVGKYAEETDSKLERIWWKDENSYHAIVTFGGDLCGLAKGETHQATHYMAYTDLALKIASQEGPVDVDAFNEQLAQAEENITNELAALRERI